MSLHKRDSGYYGWERKHRALPDGRIRISLRTKDRREAQRRTRALDLLVERGEFDVLKRLKAGDVHVVEVANAVRDEAVDDLRGRSELDLTLDAMLKRVLTTKEATRTAGTLHQYEVYGTALVDSLGRSRTLPDVSTDELRAWLYAPRGKQKKPWAPNTQRTAAMVGGFIWRLAIELEAEAAHRIGVKPRITRDPWSAIEINERAAPRKAFLEPDEWRDLIRVAEGRPVAALLGLCCLAGLRIGEACTLRTGIDVDLTEGLIRVQTREDWRPKHDRSQRDVPISDALRVILKAHIEAGYAGDRYFLHAPDRDLPLTTQSGRHWAKPMFQRAGLKYGRDGELTVHSLRHTFASLLVREGWSYALVAKLMGNTSQEVERTYAHLAPEDLNKVIASLDRMISE